MARFWVRLLIFVCTCAIGTFVANRYLALRAARLAETIVPYAVLEGKSVRMKPADIVFDLPDDWPNQTGQTLFISRKELRHLYSVGSDEAISTEVIGSVLPFEACAAHVGNKPWGNSLWDDLQARVFVTNANFQEVDRLITGRALRRAEMFFRGAIIVYGSHGDWSRRDIEVVDGSDDFLVGKSIDFYLRRFGRKTVVVVFMHAEPYTNEIDEILSSMRWSPS